MIDIKTSPSLHLGSLDTIISLSTRLAGRREFAALCIKNAIESQMPSVEIIRTVKDMIMDNPGNMRKILGDGLTDKILGA